MKGMAGMSADNGVYILETQGPEYRIAYMQAVDNLFDEYNPANGTWTPHVLTIVETFKNSKTYTDLSEAWDVASALDNDNETEYGTNLITDFREYKFSDFEAHYEKSKITSEG